jgi:peptidoglycan/xylan/chitin deacetylase (PgdA/CDA1 family)
MLSASAVEVSVSLVAAAGLAAGACAYAAMWPSSQIFGRALIAPRQSGEIVLTFDDGPNPACTPRLLDILANHQAHATFFLIGRFARSEPSLVRRIQAAGHLIGNHSWSHPNLAITGSTRVRQELQQTSDTLQQITGEPVRYFRPPYGGRRPVVLRIARELDMTPVLWNAMTNDWQESSATRIAQSIGAKINKNRARGWATNVVLHDGGHKALGIDREPSISAAELLLVRYQATHQFVTPDAWTENRPDQI